VLFRSPADHTGRPAGVLEGCRIGEGDRVDPHRVRTVGPADRDRGEPIGEIGDLRGGVGGLVLRPLRPSRFVARDRKRRQR